MESCELMEKKVLYDLFCEISGNKVDNTFHALVECKAAQKTWRLTNFAERFKGLASPDILTVFQQLTKKMSRAEFELMATTCWIIWKERNKCLLESKKLDPKMSVVKAEALMEAYQRIKVPTLIHRD